MSGTILFAEDDPVEQVVVKKMLERELPSYQMCVADDGHAVLAVLSDEAKAHDIKLIILDLNMPQMDGHETLRYLREHYPHIPVIILTASEALDDAVRAMQQGAVDFLNKPPHPESLRVAALNAMKLQTLQNELGRLQRAQSDTICFADLIGHDGGLCEAVSIGRKAAASDVPVLIHGETGVGKELFARAVHGESQRAGGAFIAVNCGAIPKDLVESTLFGHEKGSFTGAVSKAMGKFRAAEGGTIFLDEVGELPADAQVKLLRVLQQHEVEPVGAAKPVPINVRVISATNRSLQQEVAQGRFREDLYFRLHVLPIVVPPLRDRAQDIPALAEYFIEHSAVVDHLPIKDIAPDALHWIQQQNWSGNVRDLQNFLRRVLILSEGDFISLKDVQLLSPGGVVSELRAEGVNHISQATSSSSVGAPYAIHLLHDDGAFKTVEQVEGELIQQALTFFQGNVTKTAKALGIAKSTFYKKMKRYGLAED